jgi:hypothetical protein
MSGPVEISAVEHSYVVTRNLDGTDGTGRNLWYAGDAIFNTGDVYDGVGDGFIDIYSLRSVKSATQYGPTIVGNVRDSGDPANYNAWSEHWAIGNLNGLYGYGVTTYGFAAGKYGNDESFITADATNGFRILSRTGGVDTVRAKWDVLGNILIGRAAASESNIYITAGLLSVRNNLVERIGLSAAGVLTIKDGAGNAVITLDASTGAEITKKLTMPGVNSAIAIGSTPPTALNTGTGIWIDRTGMYGLLSNNLQAKFDATTGAITAGAGNVVLDVNGISISAITDYAISRAYKISNPAGVAGSLYGYYNALQTISWISLRAESQTGYSSRLSLTATAPAGQDTNVTMSVEGHASFIVARGSDGTYSADIIAPYTYVQGIVQISADEVNNLNYLRFTHSAQSDSNDGIIAAGKFSEGLNIVGVQTVAGAGRKIAFWGKLIGSTAITATVYNNANHTIPDATSTWLAFNSEYVDTDGIHSTVTNTSRLTCQTAGHYLVIGGIRWDSNKTGQRQLFITIGPDRLVIAAQHGHANDPATAYNQNVSIFQEMAVGDYVELGCYQDSGGNLDITATAYWSPNFQMIRIP